MAYTITNPQIGQVSVLVADPGIVPPNSFSQGSSTPTIPTLPLYPGMIVTAQDPVYGAAEFILLTGVASEAAGDWVSYQTGAFTATRWAGTANEGRPLAVSSIANTSATAWSWYQISGAAVANISGTVAAGDKVYWQATATTSTAAVAGKQVLGAIAGGANGTPAAGKAVININRPHSQGAIT